MAHKVNVPAKVISGNVASATTYKTWPYDDGQGDPYWVGGTNPKPYQWTVNITINPYQHGSHLTREPNQYNGLDVYVNDWISDATSGVTMRIISVISKTTTAATIIVEDVLRYNTFRSPTGDGIFNVPGTIVVFETNEFGNPILDPLPVGLMSLDFIGNIQSRFNAFALQENYMIEQAAHGFVEGDAISIDPITKLFEKLDSNSLEYMVGTVGSDGPGPDAFLLKPTTRIIENYEPALPGSIGDIIYADPASPGTLTTAKTNRQAFLQLSNAIPSSIVGTIASPTSIIFNQMKINGTPVVFSGTSLAVIVGDINGVSGTTGVVATSPLAPNIATTTLSLIYGLIGAFTNPPGPATATINGSLVTFSDNTDGLAAYALNVAIQSDMARDINAAGITNIVATSDASNIIITETTGGAITIVNVANDTNVNPFAGVSSSSGLALSTPASTNQFIKLTRADGGPIILQDVVGTPLADLGIVSADNGRLPIGLVIEQGIRKGDMYVVANIAARDALNVLVGDQAHVLDKGDQEWGLYIYDGSQWTLTSSEESARTDSDTLSVIVNHNDGGLNFIGQINAGTARIGSGTRVSPVSIEVIIPFNGTPTIEVGDVGDTGRLFTDSLVDLTAIGNYSHNPVYQYIGATDTDIFVNFNEGGATIGQCRVTMTYS